MTLESSIVLTNKLDALSFPTKEPTINFYERLAFLEAVLKMIELEDDLKTSD